MQNKYVMYTDLANETIRNIISSAENWTNFLNSASCNYSYNFTEKVLIYSQRPDAIACATIDIWNKRLKRWVKKNSKGIGILSTKDGQEYVRYLFDVSDTYSHIGKKFSIWNIKDSYHNGIIASLEDNFGDLQIKGDLAQAIFSASQNLAQDNIKDILDELLENGFELREDKEVEIINLISDSVSYMVMKRCGINPFNYLELKDYNLIKEFNREKIAMIIGANISDIAKQEILIIKDCVKNYEKNQKRTFENKQKLNYNEIKNSERDDIYERIELSNERGLYDSTSSNVRDTKTEFENGEIFKNERKIFEGTQERDVSRTNNEWQIGRTSSTSGRISTGEREEDSTRSSPEISDNRRNENERSNGMDEINEQFQTTSRRDNTKRTDLQLDFLNNVYIPPTEIMPSVEEQKNQINETEVKEDTSVFFEGNKEKNFEEELLKFELDNNIFDSEEYSRTIEDIKNDLKDSKSIKSYLNYLNEVLYSVKGGDDELTNKLNYYIEKLNTLLMEKTEFKIGQIIYLEDERKYKVESINKQYDKIVLFDMTMLEKAHYPISREESYKKALELYNKNKRNFEDKEEKKQLEKQEKINYKIINDDLGVGTSKEKIKRNIEAIKTLKKLEKQNRFANKEEQEILSQYVGWGGLPDVFDPDKESFKDEYNELKNLLTEKEYNSAMESTLTSFYTPPIVIKSIYKVLENMGFKNGNMLEPSCRSWEFFWTYSR